MHKARLTSAIATLALGLLILYAAFELLVNRIYVDEGKSLLLRYKGPLVVGRRQHAKLGYFANEAEGEIGVLERLRGPGRHFYCPIWWERILIDDVVILPGQVGLVTSKLGEDVPNSAFLVDDELGHATRKGTMRRASDSRAAPREHVWIRCAGCGPGSTGRRRSGKGFRMGHDSHRLCRRRHLALGRRQRVANRESRRMCYRLESMPSIPVRQSSISSRSDIARRAFRS